MLGIIILLLVLGFFWFKREKQYRQLQEHLMRPVGAALAVDEMRSTADDAPALALQLPEPHRLYALALLCRLQDTSTAQLDAQTAFLIRQARAEYLPKTLRAYLSITPAVRARLSAQGQSPETMLREQLELISRGIDEALRQDNSAAQELLAQGAFLRSVFAAPEKVMVEDQVRL